MKLNRPPAIRHQTVRHKNSHHQTSRSRSAKWKTARTRPIRDGWRLFPPAINVVLENTRPRELVQIRESQEIKTAKRDPIIVFGANRGGLQARVSQSEHTPPNPSCQKSALILWTVRVRRQLILRLNPPQVAEIPISAGVEDRKQVTG
ncbi:hypothetical protein PG993_008578 [Apiospora rasikravindrae]|uniref:Uncharacterized protein n=1 Tax=Apiospora rasikravindrae TaxID=990691 RepID=A0ABR1T0R0_9PEZI